MTARTPTGDVGTRMVIRAIYDLHQQRGRWPTADEIATYLEAGLLPVRAALRELRQGRLFRDRQRDRRQVWMPWSEA